ncbi:hypothetical protein AD006_30170 (plasmid) [Pseudonocardia sp. EC080610-09]|uniref:site-specific integrase n=1 Tax=unclassified Pseudonocardia TaxID=2619320 RepID=UPI000706E3C3|nr:MULTISPECIES: site-specific integrase [unclassified Pseudonocardia]ALL79504.1 hypothetical protein AD006_30170 [Pseudonocardia sp. EC080610-09]ALL85544.1 hypothetical protein AD017_31080 [Pseudonocardia sp. EC080619-01]
MSDGLPRELTAAAAAAGLVPVTDLDGGPLSAEEAAYGQASKAATTIEAYRTDWQEFCDWCAREHHTPAPAPAAAVSGYLTALARAGAKVSTMSRRMAAIRFFDPSGSPVNVLAGRPYRRGQLIPAWGARPAQGVCGHTGLSVGADL